MSTFYKLWKVSVQHEYFSSGRCEGLEFIPTGETTNQILQNRLIIKYLNAELIVFADRDIALAADLKLQFEVFSKDSNYSLYTNMLDGKHPVLYSSRARDNNVLVAEKISEKLENYKKLACAPVFIIELESPPSELNTFDNHVDFFIKLSARAFRWKYYISNSFAEYDLEICGIGADSASLFEYCLPTSPIIYRCFLSKATILSSDAPRQKFSLKDRKSSGKVLVNRLPNASVTRLGKEINSDGSTELVAEIYVNQ